MDIVIQKSVQDPLAESILAGEVKDGETVKISASKEGLTIGGHVVATGDSERDRGNAGRVVRFPKGSGPVSLQ